MIRSLWIAKTGLDAQQVQMDTITHNLANVSTNGYKRSHAVFEDLIYQNLRQAGSQSSAQTELPTGLQLGTGVRPVATGRNFAQGNLQQTSGTFDMAISGNGFFPLQMPDGTTGYTRDGAFHADAQGQLVNSNGIPLSPPITIPANTLNVTIGNDGTVSVQLTGQAAPVQVGALTLTDFINPAGMQAKGENLFVETAASGPAQQAQPGLNGVGTVLQGSLESSNVNVVEELVNMIETQRAYEMNAKSISATDAMLGYLNNNV